MQDPGSPQKTVGAVVNAISILRFLARLNRPEGVAVIARETKTNVSTCFNILRTLSGERLVVFDPEEKSYRIGLGVLEFSAPLLGVKQADIIRPELERLARERHTLIGLWQITDNERIILVDRVSGQRTVRVDMALGSRLPAYAGAVGRCYAATRGLSGEELRRHFNEVQWQLPLSFKDFSADVARAGETGYALDLGRLFIGLEIAAAVVTDFDGKARFGISGIGIAGQLSRRDLQCLAEDIRDTADWISEALYGVPPGQRQAARGAGATKVSGRPLRKVTGA